MESDPDLRDGRLPDLPGSFSDSESDNDTKCTLSKPRGSMEHDSSQARARLDKMSANLLYIDDASSRLQTFESFENLSQYILEHRRNTSSQKRGRTHDTKLLVSTPIDGVCHFITLGNFLRRLYCTDALTDVHVYVEDHVFHAHRAVLCCFSGYFSEILTSRPTKNVPIEVKLLNTRAVAFAAFLEFLYTGERTALKPDVTADLMIMADVLDVDALKWILDHTSAPLTTAEVVRMLVLSRKSCSFERLDALVAHVCRDFSKAAMIYQFLDMDVKTLCRILASDDLMVSREIEVFQVALRWIIHGAHTRIKHVTRVLRLIRYCHMSSRELVACVEETKFFQMYNQLRERVLIANWMNTVRLLETHDPFQFPTCAPRAGYSKQKLHKRAVKIEPGPSRSPTSARHEPVYQPVNVRCARPVMLPTQVSPRPADPALSPPRPPTSPEPETPTPTAPKVEVPARPPTPPEPETPTPTVPKVEVPARPPTPPEPETPTPIALKDEVPEEPATTCDTTTVEPQLKAQSASRNMFDIYVIGGFRQTKDGLDDDLTTERCWVRFCNLPSPRRHHAAVLLQDNIFMIGGCDPTSLTPHRPLASVFAISTEPGHNWQRMAAMDEARMLHCACVTGNKIYVFGGIGDTERILPTVECYYPHTNQWTYVAMMTSPRYAASAAAVGGVCYVAGGLEGLPADSRDAVLDRVDAYHPDHNTWSIAPKLRKPRFHAALVAVDNRLYLCGGATYPGNDVDCDVTHSVYAIDTYVPGSGSWQYETDMLISRHEAGVAVTGGRIYIIGGVSAPTMRILQSVECYDTCHRKWVSNVGGLPVPARGIQCVTTPHSQPDFSS